MRHLTRSEERANLLISLTDPATIIAEVHWLRAQGYTELAVWRHFLEHFAVDLDALSLIIEELFEISRNARHPHPAEPSRRVLRAA